MIDFAMKALAVAGGLAAACMLWAWLDTEITRFLFDRAMHRRFRGLGMSDSQVAGACRRFDTAIEIESLRLSRQEGLSKSEVDARLETFVDRLIEESKYWKGSRYGTD